MGGGVAAGKKRKKPDPVRISEWGLGFSRAEDGGRTRDIQLGKLALYH